MSGAGGDGGCGWSVSSGFSLPLLSSYTFPLLQHGFPTGASWNRLCPAWGSPWPLAQRPPLQSHCCQHLDTIIQCTERPRRCIWACPLSGLWLLRHTASHFSCACLWMHQDGQLFPVHGIAAWEKDSSWTLSMVKSHHTDDWLIAVFLLLLVTVDYTSALNFSLRLLCRIFFSWFVESLDQNNLWS